MYDIRVFSDSDTVCVHSTVNVLLSAAYLVWTMSNLKVLSLLLEFFYESESSF